MASKVDDDRFGSKDGQFYGTGATVLDVRQPLSLGRSSQLGVGGGEAASEWAQPRLSLTDVMKERSPDQVPSEWKLAGDMAGSFEPVTLVIRRLGEERLALGW